MGQASGSGLGWEDGREDGGQQMGAGSRRRAILGAQRGLSPLGCGREGGLVLAEPPGPLGHKPQAGRPRAPSALLPVATPGLPLHPPTAASGSGTCAYAPCPSCCPLCPPRVHGGPCLPSPAPRRPRPCLPMGHSPPPQPSPPPLRQRRLSASLHPCSHRGVRCHPQWERPRCEPAHHDAQTLPSGGRSGPSGTQPLPQGPSPARLPAACAQDSKALRTPPAPA